MINNPFSRRKRFYPDTAPYHSVSQRGFTLLELIIAITILSMVVLLIGGGFHLAMNAWEKGEAETQENQRLRTLSGLIFQYVKSIYPYKMEIEDKQVIVFKGERNSILFVTTFADPLAGGFKWIRLSYKDGALLLKEGILPDKKFLQKTTGDEEIMDPDIREVEFAYLSSDRTEWKDSWSLGEGLPSAVKVKIAFFEPFLITLPLSRKNEYKNEFF